MSPEELLARLTPDSRRMMEQLQPVLSVQGSVVHRREADRTDSWRLRFHLVDAAGERKQHAIKIPDAPTAQVVRQILQLWRERRRAEVLRLREEKRVQVRERRLMKRMAVAMAGGGRRGRKVAAAFDKAAAEGPLGLFRFAMEAPYMQRFRDHERSKNAPGLW